MKQVIQYGFGLDYLKTWNIQHALREIFQNYLDYGHYDIQAVEEKGTGNIIVKLSNDYTPTDLEFLRVGNSGKANDNTTIGQHGEGLKMAFLIFKREGLKIKLRTQTHEFSPTTYTNELGECFGIEYTKHKKVLKNFEIIFTIPQTYYDTFIKTVITKDDVLWESPTYGRIVAKQKGDIYVGGLFVCSNKNFSKAYDFNPQHIKLDRDRAMPSSFEIKWVASKLNDEYGQNRASDVQYDDMEYSTTFSEEEIKKFKPIIVGNQIQFTTEVEAENGVETQIVRHNDIRYRLLNSDIFTSMISKLRNFLMAKLGVTEMLEQFKKTHYMNSEMTKDFDIILNRSKHS